jgi:hypothetical protein
MATTGNAAQGILADDNTEERQKIIELLKGHRRLFEGYLREYEAEGLA